MVTERVFRPPATAVGAFGEDGLVTGQNIDPWWGTDAEL